MQNVTYLGSVSNGNVKKINYKSKKVMIMPMEERIIVEDMHEPLVDKETFNIVQDLIKSRTGVRTKSYDWLLKGLLTCKECGKKLSIVPQKHPNKTTFYVRCNTYACNTHLHLCTPHSNNLEKLTNYVIEQIKKRCNEFLDENKMQVSPGGKGLKDIAEIRTENAIKELKECSFRVACDVTNTLCGEQGCSAIFGPQKGATPDMIEQMDKWLIHYAKLTEEKYPKANRNHTGTGAAGGLGFAFLSYTNAVLESGIKIILEETRLEEYVKAADLVVTGEGRLDAQNVMVKAPIGVAEIAKKYGKKVIAFSGCVTEDAVECNNHGIDAYFPILRSVVSLEEAMDSRNARKNMVETVEQVFRLIKIYEQ